MATTMFWARSKAGDWSVSAKQGKRSIISEQIIWSTNDFGVKESVHCLVNLASGERYNHKACCGYDRGPRLMHALELLAS